MFYCCGSATVPGRSFAIRADMPSTSAKQHRFMEAIAHSPSFAKKAGVAQSVGKDFARADDRAGITQTHHGKPAKNRRSAESLYPDHPKKGKS